MSNRTPLQQKVSDMYPQVSQNFKDAADHSRQCRCEKCLEYWTTLQPRMPVRGDTADWDMWEDLMSEWRELCPFTDEEIFVGDI